MDAFVVIIQTVGFPIFVAVYLLHRYGAQMDKMAEAQKTTNVVLAVLVKTLTQGNQMAIPESVMDEVSGVVSGVTRSPSEGE